MVVNKDIISFLYIYDIFNKTIFQWFEANDEPDDNEW